MKFYMLKSFVWCLITFWLCPIVWSQVTLLTLIDRKPELTQFALYIRNNVQLSMLLESFQITVFAPTNAAWSRYSGDSSAAPSIHVLNYHLVKSPVKSNRFPASLASQTTGSLPIWVVSANNGSGPPSRTNYFANQARIIEFDLTGKTKGGEEQVLHVIDEVLQPVTLENSDNIGDENPSAFKFISNPSAYGIGHLMSEYSNKIKDLRKEMVFQGGDGQTFFVPINGLNQWDNDVFNLIDERVVDAHIIQDGVYFSRAFPSSPTPTLAFVDMLRVMLIVKNESIAPMKYELFVQSKNFVGSPGYPEGTIIAKILQPDIPVKNGVVHLIENPLVVTRRRLTDVILQNTQLSQFNGLLTKYGYEFVNRMNDGTVFAPNNAAFSRLSERSLSIFLNDETKAKEMLKLHLVPQRVTTTSIVKGTTYRVGTMDPTRELRFNNMQLHSLTVVGGGVNATIVDTDVVAANGVIQVIDQVMGIPFTTVYDKLASDPSLNYTFYLGKQQDYNGKFHDMGKRFTYFVPNNVAWQNVERQYPSEFYKLFNGRDAYSVHKILDHHLVVNREYSLQGLLAADKIQTVNAVIRVTQSAGRYYIEWEGERAEITTPDIETTNGKVYIISSVLFKRRDVTSPASQLPLLSLISLVASAILIRFIV